MHSVRAGARPLVVGGLLIALAALTGCGGSDSGARVLVIGDSITEGSRDQIAQALEADAWQPTIEARGGTTIVDWTSRSRALARFVKPEVAVVELGTNQRGDEAAVGAAIDRVMHGLRTVPTVLWLNVQQHKFVPPQPSAVNTALEMAAFRWSNLQVLDFNSYFAEKAQWHTPDGVHPSEAGKAAIARFIRNAVRDVERPTPPPSETGQALPPRRSTASTAHIPISASSRPVFTASASTS